MIIEGQYTKTIQVVEPKPRAPRPTLERNLATYSRDGLMTYPASCFRGTRIAIQA